MEKKLIYNKIIIKQKNNRGKDTIYNLVDESFSNNKNAIYIILGRL